MKERFVNSSISFIKKYQECDDLMLIKLNYGLQSIYSLFLKLTVSIIIALIFNTLKETCLFLLFYAGIRTFSYGMHAKSNLACWITTILIYNVIPLLLKNIVIPKYIGFIILGLALLSMIFFAPADTPKKPLIRKTQRTRCKTLSVTIVILYFIIYLLNKNSLISNALIYALLIQIIFINPLTYKVTNTKFNNYKYYKKKN